jgi:hypothetical protein
MASANPPGSKTVARAQGSVGNSGGPLDSSTDGGRMTQPAHWKATQRSRGSRMPPYEESMEMLGVMPLSVFPQPSDLGRDTSA